MRDVLLRAYQFEGTAGLLDKKDVKTADGRLLEKFRRCCTNARCSPDEMAWQFSALIVCSATHALVQQLANSS
jgi:hypothetical protein